MIRHSATVLLSLSILLTSCKNSAPSQATNPVPVTITQEVNREPGQYDDAIDLIVKETLAKGKMAGVSIAISQGAEVLFEQGYGYEHIQEKIEASSKTVYQIGSVTKQFTAVAILKLAEDGKLSLSDPVTKHIPSYPMHGKTITILNLLTHTSGIKSYTSIDSWRKEMSKNKSPQEMLTIFKDLPLEFEPGTQFSYSNSGYFLLGAIVEAVTNLTYANYMETEVFSPAGLKYTHYCTPEKAVTNRALGYQLSPNGLILDSSLSMTQPYSAGAI